MTRGRIGQHQASCLAAISSGAQTYSEIASAMNCTKSTAAHHVAALKRMGRVSRSGDVLPHARIRSIQLTGRAQ